MLFDKILAGGAVVLFIAAITALGRGYPWWDEIPGNVIAHLATILIATALTPVMMLRRRGDRLHRTLGYIWLTAMVLTAAVSFDIRIIGDGNFSLIHILSAWTLIQLPLILIRARQHDWKRHRAAVRGMVLGALLIAGFFTFPFNRMLGAWLFG